MAEETKEKNNDQQIHEALDEIDVLNEDEQDVVRVDSEHFTFSDIEFKLIENHKEAFDLEMMKQRYTDYLLKYDYIVGDISYDKLRLRGFYDDHRRGVPIDMKISKLEDYLVEYCSFGCQYFVFERVEKKKEDPESYFKNRKSNRQRKGKRSNKKQRNKQQRQNKKSKQNKQNKKSFKIRKKED